MLILTRRVGESLHIGTDVEVTVLGVKGAQIRLGIEAPRSLSIHRHEVFVRLETETRAAHRPPPRALAGPQGS
jgi:carbon storage regulator